MDNEPVPSDATLASGWGDAPDFDRLESTPGSRFDERALFALFFLSGISGLIFETVWLRILNRVLGNTTYATSVVLAAFMAGMALGSYLIGRYATGVKNQLRLYAVLEFGVAVTAVVLTAVLLRLAPFYQMFYAAFQENRFSLTIFQSVLTFALMLVPTCLMGGTLPTLSAHTRTFSMALAPRIGILYGVNTLGAVIGVLNTGFITIGQWGETATFLMGAGITVAVAILALALSTRAADASAGRSAGAPSGSPATAISPYSAPVRRLVGLAYALSGFVAISYEIIWSRMFQIQVGTSIYSFSLMLAFYLAGIGFGSLVGAKVFRAVKFPLRAFGIAQLAMAIYSILGLYLCTLYEPVSFLNSLTLSNVLAMPLVIVFPITAVLGAIFPLVCRCYVASEDDVCRSVGRLYALNTLGCIVGSLVCGFVFIWLFGTRGTIILLAVVNTAIGLVILFHESGAIGRRPLALATVGYLAVLGVLAFFGPDPFMAAVDRATARSAHGANKVQLYYHHEGVAATTTALGVEGQPTNKMLWVNGIGMTVLCVETKLMAHLPLLLHPHPRDVLVICFGMGTTVRSVRTYKAVECDVVELVPDVYQCFPYFHADAAQVLADPRIHCYADDGRNFLLVRPKQYDVITIDPAPPVWSAGTVNLYTQEFFELCKARLKDHGIVCLWVPRVQGSEAHMIIKTFSSVFSNSSVWHSPTTPVPGLFLIGFQNPRDSVRKEFRKVNNEQAILADLNEWDTKFSSVESLRGLLAFGPRQLAKLVADAPVITDDHPYTEFPLWRSLYDPSYRR